MSRARINKKVRIRSAMAIGIPREHCVTGHWYDSGKCLRYFAENYIKPACQEIISLGVQHPTLEVSPETWANLVSEEHGN